MKMAPGRYAPGATLRPGMELGAARLRLMVADPGPSAIWESYVREFTAA